jgi:hypothetical protein
LSASGITLIASLAIWALALFASSSLKVARLYHRVGAWPDALAADSLGLIRARVT